MRRKGKQAVIGTIFVVIVIIIAVITMLVKKFTPSNEVMKLSDYYKVNGNEVMVILQNEVYEKKGILLDGVVYMDYDTVVKYINKRFYFDANENLLLYTTPTEIIKTEVGSKEYFVNKSKNETNYQIVKTEGASVYIALDYVKQYSEMDYNFYEEPNRIVVDYIYGENYLYNKVKKETQLRTEPSIKSPILLDLKKEDILEYVGIEESMPKGFSKVMTVDGIVGYVKDKNLGESYYEQLVSNFVPPEYTHITKDYKINLVWHQVTNQEANNNLLNALDATKGVTTISPTWFAIINNEGEISSLASERYVERARNAGVEVWALCNDFSKDVNMYELLSYTSRREKLSNELIATAIKYNLDGLNIDFENIPRDAGVHYIQFIRELSVKCRNNGIILSIDNYVPTEYSAYYNRKEQGEVADYVITMAYDEHYSNSEKSGSVSSIGFFKDAILNTLKEVPPERTIIAIPFYTRVWKEETVDGKLVISDAAYGMEAAEKVLTLNGIVPEWDEETGQYYGEFQADGGTYKVWLEEETSIEEKMKLISENKVAGVAAWKLGLEKKSVWDVIIKYVN